MAARLPRGDQLLKPLAWYRSLASAKARRESGVFLIEGHRAVAQVVKTAPASVLELLVADRPVPPWGVPVRVLNRKQFDSIVQSKTPQGIAAVVTIPAPTYSGELPDAPGEKLLLLEGVQDPGNVGTIVRTAAALDFSGMILSDACADPFSPKAVQASAGSVLSLWLRRSKAYLEMIAELRRRGWVLVAADLDGEPCAGGLPKQHLVIALGSEGAGLSEAIRAGADLRCRIPFNSEKVESLNVAVSGGILMAMTCGG